MNQCISLDQAIDILQSGGVVAFPTETVYGLGARADIESAVSRVYEIKKRPRDNPLICHFVDADDIFDHVTTLPTYAEELIRLFSPGPVSFRLPMRPDSPLTPATAGQPTIVCRVPDHDITRTLIREVASPLVGPSANTSGRVSTTTATMVIDDLGDVIDGVIDGGSCTVGLESTIVDCTEEGCIRILRPGFVGIEDIKEVLNARFPNFQYIDFDQHSIAGVVPGLKYRHYAPDTALSRITQINELPVSNERSIIVVLDEYVEDVRTYYANELKSLKLISLGSLTNVNLIAQNLYQILKSIDAVNEDGTKNAVVYVSDEAASKLSQSAVGRAIMNRLNRACNWHSPTVSV